MTDLLRKAMDEIQKLPINEQDAIAERILMEIADDATWNALFAKTTDEQWARMAAHVDKQVRAGETMSLEEFLEQHKQNT